MTPSPESRHARPGLPGADEQALHWSRMLRCTCGHLGLTPQDTDRILEEQALKVCGIDLGLRLNAPLHLGEFYADCGQPAPWQEAEVCQLLMQEALSCDLPGITLAQHPQSRHIVARTCLPLSLADEAGWLCTAMLLAAAGHAQDIQQRFALLPDGHHR